MCVFFTFFGEKRVEKGRVLGEVGGKREERVGGATFVVLHVRTPMTRGPK